MYSPQLYGRRHELLALRSLLHEGNFEGNFLPVVQPVGARPNDLVRCLEFYGEAKQRIAVVVNSTQGDLAQPSVRNAIAAVVGPLFATYPSVFPAFQVGSATTRSHVNSFLAAHAKSKVVLAYANPIVSDSDLKDFSKEKRIEAHVCQGLKTSAAQRSHLPTEKLFDVRDRFEKQERNADYSGVELFTDRHKMIPADHCGIGDYTMVGQGFSSGGGPAAAVAIHAAFKHPKNGNIMMEHFVSDDTDMDVGTTAEKFMQAANKLVKAARARPSEFGKDAGLDAFANALATGHFFGLGTSKEKQMHHHMRLMLSVISKRL